MSFETLLAKAREYLSPERLTLLEKAYRLAEEAHNGQLRLSLEPFIQHPLETAVILADLRLDGATLAAALLHDVVEDCGVPLSRLKAEFGEEVTRLVDGVTKLTQMDLKGDPEGKVRQAANLRKMLVAMAEDIRVVLIKLADRLHNLRTLHSLPPERRKAIAQETLDVYAPLAHRLGMWDLKWQLEDLAFRHLNPQKYRELSRMLAAKRAERERYIAQVTELLKKELEKAGIEAEVTGRPKHIYSIYQKMERYAAQGKEVSEIYDLFALRVLVKEVQDCYSALGVVHSLWHPVPGQFDDYIANPKENMYQSLHTTVVCQGRPLEVQIRTYRMHALAEYGVAAHWKYKEGSDGDRKFEEKVTWLRQLLEWQRELSEPEEFLELVKTDLFRDQVFVYTPKGEIKELPAGSTPIDFAYKIHTELGHRCIGAKVNGKLVPLNYQLHNGDTVEIITSRAAKGPSLDWLNPDLGYIKTASARQKVRHWFRKQEREVMIHRGRELLQRELKHLGLSVQEEEVAKLLGFETTAGLFSALGSGSLSLSQVTSRLTPPQEPAPEGPVPSLPKTGPASGIAVLGVGDLLTRLARCCNPLPGDDIVGFVTRSRGVTVHHRDCPNIPKEIEERRVKVSWGPTRQLYPVRLRIDAWDRVGLLRDISTLVSEDKVNIASVVTREYDDNTCSIHLTLYTTGIAQLSRLRSKLEAIKGVISVRRVPYTEKEE